MAGMGNGGNVVFVYSVPDDRYYEELHLNAIFPGVVQGNYVHAGDMIGWCGSTGILEPPPAAPHDHLRVTETNQPINPLCPEKGAFKFENPETKFPCAAPQVPPVPPPTPPGPISPPSDGDGGGLQILP